jgi:pyruvate/2-oxoglutarate dehydrogenase complex dihydrolipoamide dehydrogenase (E3) component/uncharacterized membrane protein YdjX (TVP38/TMEM64 family)
MNRAVGKIFLAVLLILMIGIFWELNLGRFFTLAFLKSQHQAAEHYYAEHGGLALMIYFLVYTLMTAVSFPGALILTLAGGAFFGFWLGVVSVSFASTIGATLAFLVARFFFRDQIQIRFGDKLTSMNEGIKKDGGFYLFTLRLIPIFPFFLVNLAMGLTPIKASTYYLVSQLGMLPGTMVYVNAGTQLVKIDSLQGILSPELILSFSILGVFPWLSKWFISVLKDRKIYSKWPKPKTYDYNLVVIGAGSAGLVASYIAAAVKAKVALVEAGRMGGDCLNTGCVPSKSLLRSAKMIGYAERAREFGFRTATVDFDFADVMARVEKIIQKVAPHDSVERYEGLGVEVFQGKAEIITPFTVKVGGRTLSTRSIVIATGAKPFLPPISGMEKIRPLTSDNIWELRTLPKRLVVLGGGPIGCEMSQAFARFGSQVTQVEMAPRILIREDEDISRIVAEQFESEGIRMLTGYKALAVQVQDEKKVFFCEGPSGTVEIAFDEILIAVGRKANTQGLGLETLGIPLRPNGTLETDPFLRTQYPNIFAAGDVAGPYQFTHTASHQSWYAAVNALFGGWKKFQVDYRVIPWATFTDPEVARVGINIQEAREKKIPFEVTEFGMDELDRALAESETKGLVRILTKPGTDKILGVTLVGNHAGDIISEFILAMRHGLGLNKILSTIHIYPTLSEVNQKGAGAWKRNHAPERILQWMARYHRWMRE